MAIPCEEPDAGLSSPLLGGSSPGCSEASACASFEVFLRKLKRSLKYKKSQLVGTARKYTMTRIAARKEANGRAGRRLALRRQQKTS